MTVRQNRAPLALHAMACTEGEGAGAVIGTSVSGVDIGAGLLTAAPAAPRLTDRVILSLPWIARRRAKSRSSRLGPAAARRRCCVLGGPTSLPSQVHAIMTTRHDVRLRLHQLRQAGELAEIRGADLRFSDRETRELLEASGIALSGVCWRSVLRCSGRSNHRDPVAPPHLCGSKSGSGSPPGRQFSEAD
jgi:hypothetical protein